MRPSVNSGDTSLVDQHKSTRFVLTFFEGPPAVSNRRTVTLFPVHCFPVPKVGERPSLKIIPHLSTRSLRLQLEIK